MEQNEYAHRVTREEFDQSERARSRQGVYFTLGLAVLALGVYAMWQLIMSDEPTFKSRLKDGSCQKVWYSGHGPLCMNRGPCAERGKPAGTYYLCREER
jgi:hypothetical protein